MEDEYKVFPDFNNIQAEANDAEMDFELER